MLPGPVDMHNTRAANSQLRPNCFCFRSTSNKATHFRQKKIQPHKLFSQDGHSLRFAPNFDTLRHATNEYFRNTRLFLNLSFRNTRLNSLRKVDNSHRLWTNIHFKGVHKLTSFGSQVKKYNLFNVFTINNIKSDKYSYAIQN